ncbi:hypothetical protein K501DRAFT_306112 [Backusella circina FSU 941]|nr:hypothetical protein K501DRAFT_306112 [Backusella circina FSU 941]
MGKHFLSVRPKDPQPYYHEDESIECIVELKTEKPLKDPMITIVFKGRSSCYSNSSRIYHVPIFDVEQEMKHPRIDMESSHKRMVSAEFKVEVPKGVSIPSSQTLEVGDGGKIEYMVEAILDTASVFKRKVQATSITVIPLLSRINVDREELSRPMEKSSRWPRNEADANTCILTASIPRAGWVRGTNVPVYISWMQPERIHSVKKVSLILVRQELISSSKDTPPDMTKQLKDKVVTESAKELLLINGPNRTLSTSLQHSIEIPSNIVPTISENGKVMRLDYKICVTVQIPGMEPNGGDKELSINLPITVGTEGKMMTMDDTRARNPFNNMGRESLSGSPGGFRMPEPMIQQPAAYHPLNQFVINPEKNVFASRNSEDMPIGMPVPFPERSDHANEDPRNNNTGYFSPQSVPDCYPPLDTQSYFTDSSISLNPSNYSPMPIHRQSTTHRNSNSIEPNVSQQCVDPTAKMNFSNTQLYKPEEESPK